MEEIKVNSSDLKIIGDKILINQLNNYIGDIKNDKNLICNCLSFQRRFNNTYYYEGVSTGCIIIVFSTISDNRVTSMSGNISIYNGIPLSITITGKDEKHGFKCC
ncbi:hypothetical protein SAMN04488057_12163 [Cyclobacterium lianum]|uniref:Uncharacterized protein n=1 Tax=Cyclobacterium lianum TaxID=388280 RepID=A0A1M7QPI4_9BACT|nr:hypothetical protein [Cyclobacterium lianum]SHN33442.1 hypothetical protein SAMN04488057_12163 [Cyclobacterium lianum]